MTDTLSTLMAPLMLLLFLQSGAASDTLVTVHPGDNATLPCQAADSSISVVKWTRPDLEPEYVLLTIDGHLEPNQQHPSFKDRVELVDRDLKDGDVSLILKNVSRHDAGAYECRVKPDGPRHKKRDIVDSELISTIRIIRLQVTEPGNSMNDVPEDGPPSPVVQYHGLGAGVAGAMFLFVVAVVGVRIYQRRRDNRTD